MFAGRLSIGARNAAAAAVLAALSVCVHAADRSAAASIQKEPDELTSQDAYRVTLPGDHPDLPPEEVGRRVLKLLGKLRSFEQMSAQRVSELTGLPMKYAPVGKVHAFTVKLSDSGWYYSLTFQGGEHAKKPLLIYEFQNPADNKADMTPVCSVGYAEYEQALALAGFSSGMDRDEIGRPLERLFRRNDLMVRIMTRVEFAEKEGAMPRICVERLTAYDVE